MEILRFRSVFLDNYYLLKNKMYLTDVKQNLKGLIFSEHLHNCRCYDNSDVSTWQIFGFKVIFNSKTTSVTPTLKGVTKIFP